MASEFERIAAYLAPLATHSGALNLQDDAAVLPLPDGTSLVMTKDAMVQGVHFIGDEPPALLAQKLLATNLSDLAAMGATPLGYLLATMLPPDSPPAWLEDFCVGLQDMQTRYVMSLLGGDSTCSLGGISLSLTAIGTLPVGTAALRRNGASAGDALVVSGTLGDAAIGLKIVQNQWSCEHQTARDYFVARYQTPTPRIALGTALRGVASACMDISDGLLQDAGHIAHASGVGLDIDATALPFSPHMDALKVSANEKMAAALSGGDDYELLFTLPKSHIALLPELAQQAGVALHVIGHVSAGQGVRLHGAKWPEQTGFRHFS